MDLETQLARAVRRHARTTSSRSRVSPWLRLGPPAGQHLGFADHAAYDAGLRADVIERALDGFDPAAAPPLAWLTRSGAPVPGDLDLAWLAACREAFGRHGIELDGFYLLTREVWTDLLGDGTVTTVRIGRRRPHASAPADGLVVVHPL
ncbi:MAG: hypothetical protein ACJ72E_04090 [Marmoricola sp.]